MVKTGLKSRRKRLMVCGLLSCLLAAALCGFAWADDAATAPSDAAAATASAEATATDVSASTTIGTTTTSTAATTYSPLAVDSAGTAFTLDEGISGRFAKGDVYWAGNDIAMSQSKVGNDLMAAGRRIGLSDTAIANDVRLIAIVLSLSKTTAQGNATLIGQTVSVGSGSSAMGYYCIGSELSFSGSAERYVAYGQTIYFDGVVDGDVTLSAQNIVIGPHAEVTGVLLVRSGQDLDIPATARIAQVDNTLSQPNTIDQVTQLRSAIAPYFQVGSIFFIIVSAILAALIIWGLFERKMTESLRVVRSHPVAMLLLGLLMAVLVPVFIALGFALVLTIPLALVLLLLLLAVGLVCVPFTGASLGFLLKDKLKPSFCVAIGSAIAAALLFVPYVNLAVFALSLIYLLGYITHTAAFGHDAPHNDRKRKHEDTGHAAVGDSGAKLPREGAESEKEADRPVAIADSAKDADAYVATSPSNPAAAASDVSAQAVSEVKSDSFAVKPEERSKDMG